MPNDVFSLLGMLAIVILVLILAYWVTRWIGTFSAKATGVRTRAIGASAGAGEDFRVLGQLSLGRGERLMLVRLADRCYLLGVTAGSVTLLKELAGEEAEAWLAEQETGAPPNFLDVLKENLRKRK